MSVTILGIRHHGPGSARSVREALQALKPDAVLVEGPPDANDIISLAAHAGMRPPVAILIYSPDEPKRAVYYPFAEFSPEWQAIRYALNNSVPMRFMDLPQAHQLVSQEPSDADIEKESEPSASVLRHDPLRWIAEAAGYNESELWWEQMIEQRRDSRDLFQGILELMTALREEAAKLVEVEPDKTEALREAHMRQTIRQAQKEGFERIAVICGAWHAPTLSTMPAAREDAALLKGLPKVKVEATWVPWSYGHLTFWSGYGAGIESPGYYHHLWAVPENLSASWMARVAQLLREQDMDASSASVIEAVRLAEALAAMRGRPVPGLPELNDATRAVLCFGNDTPLQLIGEKLIVGEMLGEVPEDTPSLPLQQDLQRTQKRLRLAPEATERVLDLDLRKPGDLERSHLLHRLKLLGIPWGALERSKGKGTFHEVWRLRWQPEFSLAVIEAQVWGNTIPAATTSYALETARAAEELSVITELVEQTLLADLPEAVESVVARLQEVAAVSGDIPHLMDALTPLANVLRYGNVRQTDTGLVKQVVDGLVTRIFIGLPNACASLNDEAAEEMYKRLVNVNSAIITLQTDEHLMNWRGSLRRMTDKEQLHGLLAGRCCRLLFDQESLAAADAALKLRLALSQGNEPAQAARWVEGFLRGSGLVLLHNSTLWELLDDWMTSLKAESFTELLPLLRRTFSTFTPPERRRMGELARRGRRLDTPGQFVHTSAGVEVERANKVLPLAARLLGIDALS